MPPSRPAANRPTSRANAPGSSSVGATRTVAASNAARHGAARRDDRDDRGVREAAGVRDGGRGLVADRLGHDDDPRIHEVAESQDEIARVDGREEGSRAAATSSGSAEPALGVDLVEGHERLALVGSGRDRPTRGATGVADHRGVPDTQGGQREEHRVTVRVVAHATDELDLGARSRSRDGDGGCEARDRRIARIAGHAVRGAADDDDHAASVPGRRRRGGRSSSARDSAQ